MMGNEQHLIARFVGGLHMDIKEKIKLQPFNWLSKAISFAETVEEINELHFKNASRRGTWESNLNKKTAAPNATKNQPPIKKKAR
ncbi:uncharacterized protein E5676_scaffold129G00540 [Cucumis melo var. makuwa]|uniref:Uncharacterized protein n=1 Tax=Cucumis melo var. makuwa TaxID=1194695 RepID=A0A5D3DZZ2_CUCMM|nr:uncharacterized protein E6C27_scaffold110G001690 [Cucumis melo var. makuwa]TYK29343.1 uncharacterized protein E5676_scaffold129G00540 [Cucumis melo var. makuwa]